MLSTLYAISHLSLRVYVTLVDQSKMIEVCIIKF